MIPVLALLDAPSAALLAAALAALAAALFAGAAGGKLRAPVWVGLGLLGLTLVNASQPFPPLRPAWVKGMHEDVAHFDSIRWNSYSRVSIEKVVTGQPFFWASGKNAPAHGAGADRAAPVGDRRRRRHGDGRASGRGSERTTTSATR